MKTVREVIANKMFQQEGTNEESMWDFLVYADDILSALKEAGYAVVQVEPDDAKLKAASEAFRLAWWGADNNSRRDAYKAMISASQDQGRG